MHFLKVLVDALYIFPWLFSVCVGCFIPGISAQTIVVVTVMLKNVHATSLDSVEVPLCQAQLQLRDFDNFLVPKERIPILFLEYITVCFVVVACLSFDSYRRCFSGCRKQRMIWVEMWLPL